MLLKSKPKEADRRVAVEQLGEVYEIIVRHSLELERTKRDVENLNLQLKECNDKLEKCPESYAGACGTPAQRNAIEEGRELKNRGRRQRNIHTSTSATDYFLLVYPRDKQEKYTSVDTRLVQAISPKKLKIKVRVRKPISAAGVLVRLASKTNVEILELVIQESEALKNTLQITVRKL